MNYADAVIKQSEAKERKIKRLSKSTALGLRKNKQKKVSKAKIHKRLVKALDVAMSLYVRTKWEKCFWPSCGKPAQNCFHIFTRSKRSIRWDDRNCVGSCAGHNMIYEHDQAFIDDVRLWYISKFGQSQWDQLKRDGNIIVKHSNEDLEYILCNIANLRSKLNVKGD